MTVLIKESKVGNYSIEISQSKYSSCFQVVLSYRHNGCPFYITFDERSYSSIEQASRRFNGLVRQCEKEVNR